MYKLKRSFYSFLAKWLSPGTFAYAFDDLVKRLKESKTPVGDCFHLALLNL